MNKKLIFSLIISFALVGCSTSNSFSNSLLSSNGTSLSSEESGDSSTNQSSTTSSGGNSSSGNSSNGNSSSSSSSSEQGDQIMTIAEARSYISTLSIPVNSYGNGVDETHPITIKGYALTAFDLVKTKKDFGLNVSYPAKVIIGDATGYIGCASKGGTSGTTLFGKVGDHAGEDTSRYVITGYPSMYLGHPEISVPDNSFTWDQNLDVDKDISKYYDAPITVEQYFNLAKDVQYNCAGHGYGDIVTINSLTCYHYDSGSKVYYFTSGESIVKVVKEKLTASIGLVYNVTGIITTKDYAPALRGISLTKVEETPATNNLSSAISRTATELRNIKTSKDDTNQRFDNYILSYKNIYKANVYIGAETDSGKLNFFFSDTYQGANYIEGKNPALAKGVVFIDNDYFWNVTDSAAQSHNGYYADYLSENLTTTIYYIPVQLTYVTYNSTVYPFYKVLLLPETIPAMA